VINEQPVVAASPTPTIIPTPLPTVVPTSTPTPTPTIAPKLSCGSTPHNGTQSRIAYSASSVVYGQSCANISQTQIRTCNNGTWSAWSGTYQYLTCSVQSASACGTIASGAFELRTMYQAAAINEGQNCISEIQNRLCTNGQLGSWSGTYTQPKCVISRVRYESSLVNAGVTCKSETQQMICENAICGSWTPNYYTYATCSPQQSTQTAYNVWLDNTLTKYRQDGEDGTNGETYLSINMAKNEFESFQVMLYSGNEPLSEVDVNISPLTKGNDSINNIFIYKQHYLKTINQSRIEYPLGSYPDALLPKIDRYFGETRNTFPFAVMAGKVQGVWVDIGTTVNTVAGTYTGTVTVTAKGKTPIVRNISVTVWNFNLPSTSPFHSHFVFEQSMMTHGHGFGQSAAWSGTPIATDLAKTYMKMFLYHRMGIAPTGGKSLVGSSYLPWNNSTKKLTVNTWEPWYSIVKDTYSGTAIVSGPYAGGKMPTKRSPAEWPADSTTRTDIAIVDKETAARQYLQHVWDKFTEEGWEPMKYLFVGVKDEPRCDKTSTWRGVTMSDCNVVIDQAQDASAINTGGLGPFRNVYANSKRREGLEDFGNYGFYSANSYSLVCPGWDRTCSSGGTKISRNTYPGYPNDEMWGYLACDNNGCWITGSSAYSGQIDWTADAKALYNRFPGFIWAKYELTGTIYWGTTVDNYYATGAPYENLWYFGSNGDGQLVYPGVANGAGRTLPTSTPIIGGVHDIPIESIRMKHIRDAIEDWEYVHMAKAKVGKNATFSVLDHAFTNSNIDHAYWNLNMNPTNFLETRQAIGNILSGL